MQVLDFLKEKSLEALKNELSIKIKEYDDRIVLNYDQINSPKAHSIICECRGLILDKKHNVICRSFDRFFNLGENGVSTFDFENSVLYEKLDGSLINVYYFNDTWNIATRGTAMAESTLPNGKTYEKYFLDTLGFKSLKDFSTKFDSIFCLLQNCTFIFELVGPENRIVTPYKTNELILLGVRSVIDGKYMGYPELYINKMKQNSILNVRGPKKYSAESYEEVLKLFDSFDTLDEGVIAYNPSTGERIKIKREQYLAVHRLRGEHGMPTPKNILNLIVTGETDEVISYFPEFKPEFDKYQKAYDTLVNKIEDVYESIKNIERQKEFALAAKEYPFSSILFRRRDKGRDVKDLLSGIHENTLLKLIESCIGE